jgi:hypothetical protein
VIPPERIASRISSASGVSLYMVRVSRPRVSARNSLGVPIGMENRSAGVPWIVMPWL